MLELLNPHLVWTVLIPFMFVLIRVSTIIIVAPVFSSAYIPPQVKIGFALIFSLAIYPFVKQYVPVVGMNNLWDLALISAENLILGVMMAFTIQFIWTGIEYSANLIGFMMGFTIANVLSPEQNIQISILAEFMSIVAILVFLSINGHYLFIKAMVDSFKLVPIGTFAMHRSILSILNHLVIVMFDLSFKILAPAVVALIITNVIFGVLARIMPQMNVMIVAFPLSIGLGLFAFALSLNFSADVMVKYYGYAVHWIYSVLKGF